MAEKAVNKNQEKIFDFLIICVMIFEFVYMRIF